MSDRDRDAAGRPENARPRDSLGRPLPPGSAGVARVPADLDLTPAGTLRESQRLLDEGLPFHAHEVLEAAWKSCPDRERRLWQGLAQLAVGLTHELRGNPVGAARVRERGAENLRPYAADPLYGVDVVGLLAWAAEPRTTAPRLSTGPPAAPPLSGS